MSVLQEGHLLNGLLFSHSRHTQRCKQFMNRSFGSFNRHTTHLSELNGSLTVILVSSSFISS